MTSTRRRWALLAINLSAGIIASLVTGCETGDQAITQPTFRRARHGSPGQVTDLEVISTTGSSVTLSFTEVDDGTGRPASYDVRWAPGTILWGSATPVAQGTCTVPMPGTAIGATRSCTVLDLQAGTTYGLQLIAFRGTLNENAVFGALSNVVIATTAEGASPVEPVESVTVTPGSASVTAGQTVQLTATPKDAGGTPLTGRVVTWGSSNTGVTTVNGTGFVTGVAAGSATITATSEGKTGSAALTITPAATPPADTIFAEGFESGNLSQWQDGVDPARHHVLTDGTFARSGSRYLEITYPAGGDGGYLGRFFMPGYDSVYVSYYIRFDPAWTGMTKLMSVYGDRIDNQWSAFGKAGICPNGTDFFNAFLTTEPGTGDPGNLRFYTYYPDMAREPDGVTCWGRYGDGSETYTPPLGLSKGVWHRIELWVKANTPGQYNAAQKVWIDGVLRGSWSGFRFRTTTDLRLNAFLIIATAAPTSVARKLYIDDIIILPSSKSP